MSEVKQIGVYLSDPEAKMPTRPYTSDVGFDVYAIKDVIIPFGASAEIKTGLHLALPEDIFVQVNVRSSFGKNGYFVHHGVIDPGYTGEISIFVFNVSAIVDENGVAHKGDLIISKGQRIAQLLFHEAIRPELTIIKTLPQTERGENGIGSSGK